MLSSRTPLITLGGSIRQSLPTITKSVSSVSWATKQVCPYKISGLKGLSFSSIRRPRTVVAGSRTRWTKRRTQSPSSSSTWATMCGLAASVALSILGSTNHPLIPIMLWTTTNNRCSGSRRGYSTLTRKEKSSGTSTQAPLACTTYHLWLARLLRSRPRSMVWLARRCRSWPMGWVPQSLLSHWARCRSLHRER